MSAAATSQSCEFGRGEADVERAAGDPRQRSASEGMRGAATNSTPAALASAAIIVLGPPTSAPSSSLPAEARIGAPFAPRARAERGGVGFAEGGRVDHAGDRPPVVDERDRHRPAWIAGEKGARAVDRIDDERFAQRGGPNRPPSLRRASRRRERRRAAVRKVAVDGEIGVGDRRAALLRVDARARRLRRSGNRAWRSRPPLCRVGELVERQRGREVCVDRGSHAPIRRACFSRARRRRATAEGHSADFSHARAPERVTEPLRATARLPASRRHHADRRPDARILERAPRPHRDVDYAPCASPRRSSPRSVDHRQLDAHLVGDYIPPTEWKRRSCISPA